jgi:hypothetical protein
MRRRLVLVCGMVALVATLSTGCLFNIFQTARTVGGGNLAFTIGAGVLMLQGDGTTTNLAATPQARLTLGLADAVDLGLQTGALIPFSSGDPGWLGAIGDLKFRLFDEPDAFALALGFGGGYSVEYVGWGLFGEVFFDSNLRVLPIYFVYQPGIPLVADSFTVFHHLAGGLKLQLSDHARILLQADYRTGILSFGLAFEVGL